jgi:Planctomycete cytochrome C
MRKGKLKEMKHRTFALSAGIFAALGVALGVAVASLVASAAEVVSYKLDVKPILDARCVSCHSPGGEGYKTSGLDLSTYEGLMKGTKHGPIIVPGEPLTSNLNVLVEGRAQVRMPHHERPLLVAQTEILREWVKQGAKNN